MELRDDISRGLVRPFALDARQVLLLIALGVTAVRLVAAGTIHLTEDEAYYRIWAQHLQLGYYDHPPMIAWWIAAGERLAGDTPLGVRLLPTLATGLTTWLVGDLALRLGARPATAALAALWYNATLIIALGGMLAVPDAPASLFWIATLWCLAIAWESGRNAWWLAAGAAAGLSLLSKYSGLFLAPGVLLWLLLIPGGAGQLRRWGPWAAALAAVLLFSVNVAWNAEHGWATFGKQFGRAGASGLHLRYLPEFLFAEFLLLNPLIAVYAARGAALGWRTRRRPDGPNLMLLIATSAPFAVYLLAHSLHDRVQAHWPVPMFGALAICAAVAAEASVAAGRGRLAPRLATVLGFSVAALGLVHMAAPGAGSLGTFDPAISLRGWPGFARDVERLRQAQGAAWVGTESYGVAAQLDAERRIAAPLLEVIERDRYRKDAAIRPDFTRPGLIVDLDRRMARADVLRCFAVVEPAGVIDRGEPGGPAVRYTAFRVSGPRRDVWAQGCPEETGPGVWR
jgi:4-amino-4-deoxy-L-arabinose transferase-like glycosyltransferase